MRLGNRAMNLPRRHYNTAVIAVSLSCLCLGALIAAIAAAQQPSGHLLGESFGMIGAIVGLTCAALGMAVERNRRGHAMSLLATKVTLQ